MGPPLIKGTRPIELLLVEDNPADIRLTKEALKQTRFAVNLRTALDGEAATEFLQLVTGGLAPRPDLILLDLNLPRKNGREVLAEIKLDEKLKQIPVIVMTTSRSEEDIATVYSLNANCYISKPSDMTEFEMVISAIETFWFSTATSPEMQVPQYPTNSMSGGRKIA